MRSMGMLVLIAAAAVVVQRLIDAPNRDALAVMVVMPAMAFVAFRRRRHVKQYVEFRTEGGATTFERWATMSRAERRERVLAGRPGGPSGRRRARAAAGAATGGAEAVSGAADAGQSADLAGAVQSAESIEWPAGWAPPPGAHLPDDEVAAAAADRAADKVR